MTYREFCRAIFVAALVLCCRSIGSTAVAAPPDGAQPSAGQDAASDATIEQVGRIRLNVTHPEVDAPYSLVDRAGMILCYVRPAQGVNLDRYVNRPVRVRGQRVQTADDQTRMLEVGQIGPAGNAGNQPPAAADATTAGATMSAGGNAVSTADLAAPDTDQHVRHRHRHRNVRQVGYDQNAPDPSGNDFPQPGQSTRPISRLAPGNGGLQTNAPNNNGQMANSGPISDNAPPPDGYGPGGQWDDGNPLDGGDCDGPSCSTCGGCGHAGCSSCCHGFCGPPGRVWVRVEYLYWWTEGMRIPPLVTTGPSASQPGYLGADGTTILYGGSRVDGYGRSGGRLTVGTWLNPCQTFGVEGDYFALASATSSYSATSSGSPILSRPYYDTSLNTNTNLVFGPSVEQVALPNTIAGTVSADTFTRFQGAGVRMLFNLCCGQKCVSNPCFPCLSGPAGYRLDFLLGYRYLQLQDGVSVNENLSSQIAASPGTFLINDSFRTSNQFNGVDFGTMMQMYRGNRWSLSVLSKIALGNNFETVDINGSNTTTVSGVTTTSAGGLLAQTTNIGHYQRNQFAVVPELGVNLGYQLTPRLRAIVGYTFIFWSNVARAGDQIDTSVNGSYVGQALSGATVTGDPRHPLFAFQTTEFWRKASTRGSIIASSAWAICCCRWRAQRARWRC